MMCQFCCPSWKSTGHSRGFRVSIRRVSRSNSPVCFWSLGLGVVGSPSWMVQPVGYLVAVYVFSLEHLGLTAEIDEFMVLDQHRGHGVGSALLGIAETTFSWAGCTKVSLQLSRRNDAARALLPSPGIFGTIGVRAS